MTYLLIDNSNTRTKFVLSSPEALLPERYMIPTREVSGERLDEVLDGVRYDAAVVCSVVPRVAEELKTGSSNRAISFPAIPGWAWASTIPTRAR